jgi:asparagine synthase (glutamine-hydrolysing)
MAAFVFVLSADGSPLQLPEPQRQRVFSALQERSPGAIEEHSLPEAWAALSGPFGSLSVSGQKLLLCDGARGEPGPGSVDPPDGSKSCAACAYDADTGEVRLVRDRFGTRPIFYARHGGRWLVASECKVLQALGVPLDVHPQALRESLMYRWVTGESCLLSPGVRVPEGTEVVLRDGDPPRKRRFWRFTIEPEPLADGAFERYQDAVDEALRSSLRGLDSGGGRVGVLLSGGVDSSLLTALIKEEMGDCVAFGFRIAGFENPELARARIVTDHLGVELREVDIDPARFPDDLRHIMRRMEELPRHPNDLVLLQLVRRASREVKLLLQGDAADTLFGLALHRRTQQFTRKKNMVRGLPGWLVAGAVRVLERLPVRRAWPAARVLAWDEHRLLQARDAIQYKHLVRRTLDLSHLDGAAWESGEWSPEQDLDELRRAHLVSSGIQGSLIRHDRLSRPEGIDSLAPYLSPEVVSVACRMPRELAWREVSKPVLRALCDRYLPPEVSRWSKGRFDVPRREWLFGPLRPLCEEAERALQGTGHLPRRFLRAALDSRDVEGVWSGLSLYLLLKEFDLLEVSP